MPSVAGKRTVKANLRREHRKEAQEQQDRSNRTAGVTDTYIQLRALGMNSQPLVYTPDQKAEEKWDEAVGSLDPIPFFAVPSPSPFAHHQLYFLSFATISVPPTSLGFDGFFGWGGDRITTQSSL